MPFETPRRRSRENRVTIFVQVSAPCVKDCAIVSLAGTGRPSKNIAQSGVRCEVDLATAIALAWHEFR